jgi:hypothetical protein
VVAEILLTAELTYFVRVYMVLTSGFASCKPSVRYFRGLHPELTVDRAIDEMKRLVEAYPEGYQEDALTHNGDDVQLWLGS